jgi:hypothetical protein
MKQKKFIKVFNKASQKEKAKMLIAGFPKEPTQQLAIELKGDGQYTHFHIMAYSSLRVGIWYAVTIDDRRIVMSAFALHPEGEKTFKEWAWHDELPKVFAESIREKFIAAFDHIVLPENVLN